MIESERESEALRSAGVLAGRTARVPRAVRRSACRSHVGVTQADHRASAPVPEPLTTRADRGNLYAMRAMRAAEPIPRLGALVMTQRASERRDVLVRPRPGGPAAGDVAPSRVEESPGPYRRNDTGNADAAYHPDVRVHTGPDGPAWGERWPVSALSFSLAIALVRQVRWRCGNELNEASLARPPGGRGLHVRAVARCGVHSSAGSC